jgi:hypothetical protein
MGGFGHHPRWAFWFKNMHSYLKKTTKVLAFMVAAPMQGAASVAGVYFGWKTLLYLAEKVPIFGWYIGVIAGVGVMAVTVALTTGIAGLILFLAGVDLKKFGGP